MLSDGGTISVHLVAGIFTAVLLNATQTRYSLKSFRYLCNQGLSRSVKQTVQGNFVQMLNQTFLMFQKGSGFSIKCFATNLSYKQIIPSFMFLGIAFVCS